MTITLTYVHFSVRDKLVAFQRLSQTGNMFRGEKRRDTDQFRDKGLVKMPEKSKCIHGPIGMQSVLQSEHTHTHTHTHIHPTHPPTPTHTLCEGGCRGVQTATGRQTECCPGRRGGD